MKFIRIQILLLALLIISVNNMAQFDPSGISQVENGKIQITLDRRWTEIQKKEVEKLFNLDSTLWKKISVNIPIIFLDSVRWDVSQVSNYIVELSKDIDNIPAPHFNINDIFLIDENWQMTPGYVDQEKVIYGSNHFKKNQNFQYKNGQVLLFLSGYLKNNRANIAGSFNNWDPSLTPMEKVDSGWVVTIPLKEGKYFYKFILDGNWMTDPNNYLDEDDGQGNKNSTLYCPNFLFQLTGYSKARKVTVAGTFNNWNRSELKMFRTSEGWALPVYLKDGTYSYKFIVDDQWITDPSNKVTRTDAKGIQNSVIANGDEYIFRLNGYKTASRVIIAGNFNNWNQDELLMLRNSDGWQLPYQLAPGNYEYKFIADGKWIADPSNPYKTGSGDEVNSCLAFKSNYIFSVNEFPDAKEVIITGSFYNWNPDGYKMVKKDGKWIFPVYLSRGKYLYKLIVDGKWLIDPSNKLWEENEYGTGNSVLWIMDSKF